MNQGDDVYGQIISTWRFLQVGLFIDKFMQGNSEFISNSCIDYTINNYTFDKDYISTFIPKTVDSKNGITYFGSHVFHFSVREIFSCTYEALEHGDKTERTLKYKTFVTNFFGKNELYNFSKIIELCRHVYVHNLRESLNIKLCDINKLRANVVKNRSDGIVSLDLDIKEIFSGSNPKTDILKIDINFNELKDNDPLYQTIHPHDMMGLIELCGLLAQEYIQKRASQYLKIRMKS